MAQLGAQEPFADLVLEAALVSHRVGRAILPPSVSHHTEGGSEMGLLTFKVAVIAVAAGLVMASPAWATESPVLLTGTGSCSTRTFE